MKRRLIWPLVSAMLFGFGCHHKRPVNLGDGGVPDPDAAVTPDVGIVACFGPQIPKEEAPLLHQNKLGGWQVALRRSSSYVDFALAEGGDQAAAATIDHFEAGVEVAGFLLSREASAENVQGELALVLAEINARTFGAATVRASGTQSRTHDGYQAVKGTILEVNLIEPISVSRLRNELLSVMLRRPRSTLPLPKELGAPKRRLVVRFATVRRYGFKRDAAGKIVRDAKGNAVDSGDKSQRRLIVIGAVAAHDDYQDTTRATSFVVDDLSNGTALATPAAKLDERCESRTIAKLPVADIIWVIDESGSMSNNRLDIVNNANAFFSRALAAGLDFRMGVTNVVRPGSSYDYAVGKFCSRDSVSKYDDGGDDRFLLPSEQALFSACVKNPPGWEGGSEYGLKNAEVAVKRHLPRSFGDPAKIRPNASLAIIVVTDEVPRSLTSLIGSANYRQCTLPTDKASAVKGAVKRYIDLFSGAGNAGAQASFHVIGGVCANACRAQIAHGYREVAQARGGQVGDVCQRDLGSTLQVIIDSIVGAASPAILSQVPISATLAVALDGKRLDRSRTRGFDYRAINNSVALINVPFRKGSQMISSYQRWLQQ